MPVRVRLVPGGRVVELEIQGRVKVAALLERLGLNSESAVVVRAGRPLTEDEVIVDGDQVDVVRVLTGGSQGSPHCRPARLPPQASP